MRFFAFPSSATVAVFMMVVLIGVAEAAPNTQWSVDRDAAINPKKIVPPPRKQTVQKKGEMIEIIWHLSRVTAQLINQRVNPQTWLHLHTKLLLSKSNKTAEITFIFIWSFSLPNWTGAVSTWNWRDSYEDGKMKTAHTFPDSLWWAKREVLFEFRFDWIVLKHPVSEYPFY